MPKLTQARSVAVVTRHAANCPDKDEGPTHENCKCWKSLVVYDDGKQSRVSAHTRSWKRAVALAQEYRDEWDPRLKRLKEFEAAAEAKRISIERAVGLYIADMVTRLGEGGTTANARSLFGHVNSQTHEVTNPGHLFVWLATLPPAQRPADIVAITTAHLTQWRAAWKFSDYTAAVRWGMVKSFFNFCEAQGWIADSPARKLRRIEYASGSRTAIFTDEQYNAILDAVANYEPENLPAVTRAAWQQRVTTFVELLRWSGMALIDAVQWRPELMDSDGVLRYRRVKTGELATVALPEHLIALLRSVPLERDSIGPSQPFRSKDFAPHSDTVTWRKRLQRLFALAGISEVRNELGKVRPPHPHQLRDTMAVWYLRHGTPLHALAKMLGHSNPTTTAKSYLPFVQELEKQTIAEARAALKKGAPKDRRTKIVSITTR